MPNAMPNTPSTMARMLLALAAVAVIVVGSVALVATIRGDEEPKPEATEPSVTESVPTIPTTAPKIPYVVDQRLYVDGEQVPGTWWSVRGSDAGWLALRTDDTWWWGRGPDPTEILAGEDKPPVISPDGRYIAIIRPTDAKGDGKGAGKGAGKGVLTGFDTETGDPGWGSVPVQLGDPEEGSRVYIRAVTNDGKVVAQGMHFGLLWLPLAGSQTIDLTETAPGRTILDGTPGGVVAADGDGYEPAEDAYLAELSDDGELTPIVAIPDHDDVEVSPGSEWLVYTPAGTTGGEVTQTGRLHVQTVDGTQRVTLMAPTGWGFQMRSWVWEDDDHLVSPMYEEGGGPDETLGSPGSGRDRMARCSVQLARCILIDSH